MKWVAKEEDLPTSCKLAGHESNRAVRVDTEETHQQAPILALATSASGVSYRCCAGHISRSVAMDMSTL